jgi:hypothetical protein
LNILPAVFQTFQLFLVCQTQVLGGFTITLNPPPPIFTKVFDTEEEKIQTTILFN